MASNTRRPRHPSSSPALLHSPLVSLPLLLCLAAEWCHRRCVERCWRHRGERHFSVATPASARRATGARIHLWRQEQLSVDVKTWYASSFLSFCCVCFFVCRALSLPLSSGVSPAVGAVMGQLLGSTAGGPSLWLARLWGELWLMLAGGGSRPLGLLPWLGLHGSECRRRLVLARRWHSVARAVMGAGCECGRW